MSVRGNKPLPSFATYDNENENVQPKNWTRKKVCVQTQGGKKRFDVQSCNRQNQVIIKKGNVKERLRWNGKRERRKKRVQEWAQKNVCENANKIHQIACHHPLLALFELKRMLPFFSIIIIWWIFLPVVFLLSAHGTPAPKPMPIHTHNDTKTNGKNIEVFRFPLFSAVPRRTFILFRARACVHTTLNGFRSFAHSHTVCVCVSGVSFTPAITFIVDTIMKRLVTIYAGDWRQSDRKKNKPRKG